MVKILMTFAFFMAFGEPIIMPILSIIIFYICYCLDDGKYFYK